MASERVVDRVVTTAVNTVVDHVVDRVVDMSVSAVVDSAFDNMFSDVLFEPGFELDVYSGAWNVAFSGPINRSYQKQAVSPADDLLDPAVGIRGVTDTGRPFYGLNFSKVRSSGESEFTMVFFETVENADEVVQRLMVEIDGIQYEGDASVTLTTNSTTRIAGELSAPSLVSAATPDVLAVSAAFNVPINPKGSLAFSGVQ